MTESEDIRTTRAAYDTVAADYAETLRDDLAGNPFDRAVLDLFAELVDASEAVPVADVGCGPGRIAGYLAQRGLPVRGIDLSPGMVAVARRDHPQLRFDVGTMLALDIVDGALSGVVAWYSIIHTPPERLPAVFAEFRRVLAPGGCLALAFQVGSERVHGTRAYGHDVTFDAYRLPPDEIEGLLTAAGFELVARTVRQPFGSEKTPQAYLIARLPVRPT